MKHLLEVIAFVAAMICVSRTAHADDKQRYIDPAEQTRFSLNLDWWPSADANVLAFDVDAQVMVHKNVAVDVQVPWAAGTLVGNTRGTGGSGNVVVGVYGMGHVRPYGVLWGGISIPIPTLYGSPNTRAETARESLLTFAAMSHDGLDPYRFLPGVSGSNLNFGWGIQFARYFHYRGYLTIYLTVPSGIQSNAFAAQLEEVHELEGRFPFGLILGMHFQGMFPSFPLIFVVKLLTNYQPINGFTGALGPYIGYEPEGYGFFARLGFNVGSPPLSAPFSQSAAIITSATFGYRL